MRSLVAAAVLAASATSAAAEATIIKGGPRDAAGVPEVLDEANAAMAVCGRAATGADGWTADVKVEVRADGSVKATAVGFAAAAQCAAGIMAVWKIPGAAWTGTIRFTGAASVDLSSVIQGRLLERSASIKACQAKAPTAAGPVMIKMKVDPKGTLSNVEVTSSLGAAINTCVKSAVSAMNLDAIPAKAPVSYALAVSFIGKSSGPTGSGAPVPVEAPDGGTVAGGLAVDQVKTVMSGARTKLQACGKKGKAKGTVTTRFTIRPDGTTKNVVIKTPIGDAAIEACLVDAFKSLKFPSSGDETKVSYPVAFR